MGIFKSFSRLRLILLIHSFGIGLFPLQQTQFSLASQALVPSPVPMAAPVTSLPPSSLSSQWSGPSCDCKGAENSCKRYSQERLSPELAAIWGATGQQCDAIEFYDEAKLLDLISIVGFGVAATACWAACGCAIATVTGAGSACLKPAVNACVVTKMAGAAFDTFAEIKLMIDGKNILSQWDHVLGGFLIASHLGVLGIGTYELATNATAKEVLGEGKVLSPKAATALVCSVAAGITALAAFKGYSIYSVGKHKCKSCDAVNEAVSSLAGASTAGGVLPMSASPVDPQNLSAAQGSPSPQGQSAFQSAAATARFDQAIAENTLQFPSGAIQSALMSAPIAPVLAGMPSLSNAPVALAAMGTSLPEMAQEFASGKSPSDVILDALPPGMPWVIRAEIQELGRLAEQGKIAVGSWREEYSPSFIENGMPKASGSGASAGLGANGGRQASPTAGAGEAQEQILSRSPSSDIWHSESLSSLFQIVSARIKLVQNRVGRF